MKTAFLLLFAFGVALSGAFSQSNFPAAWQGKWAGTLEIFNQKGKVQSLPMELHLLPKGAAGAFTWTIIYGEDKVAGARNYELLPLDTAKGWYLLDEKNTIRMEAYLLDGKLFQWFEVQGNLLYTSTELVGEELIWEIISGSTTPVSTTGGQPFEGEEISPVKTFPVAVLQRARLRRMP